MKFEQLFAKLLVGLLAALVPTAVAKPSRSHEDFGRLHVLADVANKRFVPSELSVRPDEAIFISIDGSAENWKSISLYRHSNCMQCEPSDEEISSKCLKTCLTGTT
jgi:hypothetical protein